MLLDTFHAQNRYRRLAPAAEPSRSTVSLKNIPSVRREINPSLELRANQFSFHRRANQTNAGQQLPTTTEIFFLVEHLTSEQVFAINRFDKTKHFRWFRLFLPLSFCPNLKNARASLLQVRESLFAPAIRSFCFERFMQYRLNFISAAIYPFGQTKKGRVQRRCHDLINKDLKLIEFHLKPVPKNLTYEPSPIDCSRFFVRWWVSLSLSLVHSTISHDKSSVNCILFK